MKNKSDALSEIIALAHKHQVTLSEIGNALKLGSDTKPERSIVMRLFSYLGGIFIFAGVSAYIGMFWDDMNSAARVIITLGSGFVAYLIGIIFSREPQRKNIVAPIMLFAVLLESGGLFVLIDEYFNNHTGNWRLASLIVFGVMLLQQGLTFISLHLAVMLFTSLCFGTLFFSIAFDMLGVDEEWSMIIIGVSLLGIAYGLRTTIYHHSLQLCCLVGSLCFLYGAFDVLQNSPIEILYLAIACFMVYVSIMAQSTTLLVISILSMVSYIGYFTEKHFVHSVGWPIALVLFGFAFFGISAGAFKLKKKYISN